MSSSLIILTLFGGVTGALHAAVSIVEVPLAERDLGQPAIRTFDINSDGVPDLRFEPAGSGGSLYSTRVYPLNGAQVLRDTTPANAGAANLQDYLAEFATAVIGPVPVVQPDPNNPYLGPSTNFAWHDQDYLIMAFGFQDGGPNFGGNFLSANHGYLAYSFMAGGDRFYGWFDIGMTSHTGLHFYEYGFENVAGQSIYLGSVPEPGRVALLGLAAVALLFSRRR